MKLTERQKEILNYVENYIKLNAYPPSIRDIGEHFNISSPRGVAKHLEALEKKGYIERTGVSRGIRIIKNSDGTEYDPAQDVIMVPLAGVIAAGEAIQAVENREESVPVPASMIRKGFDYFVLKVKGNSMVDSHILNGDLVVLRKQEWANNGDVVAALIDNENATLKKFENQGPKIRLIPSNPDMLPILVEANRLKVQGKMVGLLRWYK